MSDAIQPGPCMICGRTNYLLSFGGPTICPSCDCGDFGLKTVQRQKQEIDSLLARIKVLEEALSPFAIPDDGYPFYADSVVICDSKRGWHLFVPANLTMGDFRRASRAIESAPNTLDSSKDAR